MTAWQWPGARWWRVDLHAHTPASYDFKPDTARQAKDWNAWQAAKNAGLDAVAVTDHNCPDGIPGIAAAGAQLGLTVFPGIELTVGGIHLLCLLDPSKTRDAVVALLSRLGVDPGGFSSPETISNVTVVQAIEEVCKADGVASHVPQSFSQ